MGIAKQFSIVLSDFILSELVRVLRRPRFETSEDEIHKIVLALMQTGEVVNVRSRFRAVKGDPSDDAIVNTAHDGRAGMIVTGDSHLLRLKSFKGIQIVSVSEALQQLNEYR